MTDRTYTELFFCLIKLFLQASAEKRVAFFSYQRKPVDRMLYSSSPLRLVAKSTIIVKSTICRKQKIRRKLFYTNAERKHALRSLTRLSFRWKRLCTQKKTNDIRCRKQCLCTRKQGTPAEDTFGVCSVSLRAGCYRTRTHNIKHTRERTGWDYTNISNA